MALLADLDALAALAAPSSSAAAEVTLLRLRLRFGSPRRVALGVAFRVAVDLVDEMAQPPAAGDADANDANVALHVALKAAAEGGEALALALDARVTRTAQFQWRVECTVSPRATSTTVSPAVRLRVSCVSTVSSPPLGGTADTRASAALQRFCAGSQWLALSTRALALVLPVLSDEIALGSGVDDPQHASSSTTISSSRCVREFALPSPLGVVRIEEDYGHAMGSHVWDAGIWLALALAETASHSTASLSLSVVELGAGCGLVACVLARLHADCAVVTTERRDALPLLQANVTRNGVASAVSPHELLWGDGVALPLPRDAPPDVVLAADVLYHWSAHEPLLATLSALCGPATRVLIAHTRRSAAAAQRLDNVVASGGGDAACAGDGDGGGCALATHWRVQRLARLGHRVDLLQLTRRQQAP